jgi:L-alanine-DL-glutamate epimerase-like enolase superfamily enzyme
LRIARIDTVRLDEFPSLLWVLVHADEGPVGLGETFFGPDVVEAHVHAHGADVLLGADPTRIERHVRALRGYVGAAGSGAETRAASALEIALWDLRGKALGEPLHALLGGRSRDRIRTYNTCAGARYIRGRKGQAVDNWGVGEEAPDALYEDLEGFLTRPAELAQELLAQGITGMKIWPFDGYAEASDGHDISGADLERGLEPFRRIRESVGGAMDLMVELHALWDVPAARRIAAALDEIGPYWIEDPVRVDSPDALAAVAAATRAPLAVGETLSGVRAFRELLGRGGVDVAILDLAWVGGIAEARKVAALAESFDRPVAPHDCTGPVVFSASTHLSLHLPNAILQESVRAFWAGWYRELVSGLPIVEDGTVRVGDEPGHGVSLRPELLERPDCHVRTSQLRPKESR